MGEVVFLKSNLMKIIEEIEKSRLTDENMAAITGGVKGGPEDCVKVEYRSCDHVYKTQECMIHRLDCDSYMYCGPDWYMNSPCTGCYGECNKFRPGTGLQLA